MRDAIRNLDSLLDFEAIMAGDAYSRAMLAIIGFGALILFVTSAFKYGRVLISGEFSFKAQMGVWLPILVLFVLFCTPVYNGIVRLAWGLLSLNSDIGDTAIREMQMQLGILNAQELESLQEGSVTPNPEAFKSTIDVLLASLFLFLMKLSLYFVRTIPVILFIFTVLIGPIVAGMSPVMNTIMKKWVGLMCTAIFMGVFINVLIEVITASGVVALGSETLKEGMPLMLLVICAFTVLLIGSAITMTGFVFGTGEVVKIFNIITPIGWIMIFISLQKMGFKIARKIVSKGMA